MRSCQIITAALALLAFRPSHAQIEWRTASTGFNSNLWKVVFTQNAFYAGTSSGSEGLFKSDDGETWSHIALEPRLAWRNGIQDFTVSSRGPLAFGRESFWNSDGKVVLFEAMPAGEASIGYLNGVAIMAGLFPRTGPPPYVVPQIARWQDSTQVVELVTGLPGMGTLSDWVVVTESEFIVSSAFKAHASSDGFNWVLRGEKDIPSKKPFFGGGSLFAPGKISHDFAATWQTRRSSVIPLAYGEGYYLSGGVSENVAVSTDGDNWVKSITGSDKTIRSVTYGKNQFVGVGDSGRVIIGKVVLPIAVPELSLEMNPVPLIRWQSAVGFKYHLEYTTQWVNGWFPYGGVFPQLIIGDGTEKSIKIYPKTIGRKAYFRLRVHPA